AERRRSEAALKQGRERLRLALDGAELGAFSADFATGGLECDARAAQIHGQNLPPMTMKESMSFVHPDHLSRIYAALAEAQRTGGVWNVEYRVVPPPKHPHAGETRWVALESSITRDLQGAPVGLLGVTRDITVHKRTEVALRASEARLAQEAMALARLHNSSSRLWQTRALNEGLVEMLRASIAMMGADKGTVQVMNTRGVLTIAAQEGFDQSFLEFFKEVSAEDKCACGRALRDGHRIII